MFLALQTLFKSLRWRNGSVELWERSCLASCLSVLTIKTNVIDFKSHPICQVPCRMGAGRAGGAWWKGCVGRSHRGGTRMVPWLRKQGMQRSAALSPAVWLPSPTLLLALQAHRVSGALGRPRSGVLRQCGRQASRGLRGLGMVLSLKAALAPQAPHCVTGDLRSPSVVAWTPQLCHFHPIVPLPVSPWPCL